MAKISINSLKQYFKIGLKPTQSQFWDFLDSFFHKDEKIPLSSLDGLQTEFDKYATKDYVDNHAGGGGGTPGVGIQSTSYNPETGVLTITFTDATTYQTGDLRGATGTPGKGIQSTSYNAATGVVTITYTDATTYETGDLRGAAGTPGKGIQSTSYNAETGVLTITYTDSSTFSTGDLRGTPGTNAPLTISLFKQSTNGITYPVRFKWPTNKTVSSVQLMLNCTAISVTIGATTYDQTSLVGVTLNANTELVVNDITIQTGYSNANALIIF